MSIKRKRRARITQNIRMAAQQQLDKPIDESSFSKKDREVKELL